MRQEMLLITLNLSIRHQSNRALVAVECRLVNNYYVYILDENSFV